MQNVFRAFFKKKVANNISSVKAPLRLSLVVNVKLIICRLFVTYLLSNYI